MSDPKENYSETVQDDGTVYVDERRAGDVACLIAQSGKVIAYSRVPEDGIIDLGEEYSGVTLRIVVPNDQDGVEEVMDDE